MEFSIDGFDPQHFGFQDPDTDPIKGQIINLLKMFSSNNTNINCVHL